MTEHPSFASKSLGAMFNQVACRIRHDLNQRLRQHGLDITIWPLLHGLWQQDGIPQARLGELAGLADYATSRAIDRLESAGLVVRRHDPDNRRVRLVCLTEKGRACQSELMPLAASTTERVVSRLDAQEQQDLYRILSKIIDVL